MASAPEIRKPSDGRDEAKIHKMADTVGETSNQARDLNETTAAGVETATDAAASMAGRVAQQGRETLNRNLRTMAEAGAPLADMSYGEGRRFVEASAHVADVYQKASSDTADDVQALVASYSQFGRGMQHLQSACIGMMQESLANAKRHPQDLFRCRSPGEFAEVQRELYTDGVRFMLRSSVAMFRMAGQVMQSAAAPLETREQARH